jgi:hypothetical protein
MDSDIPINREGSPLEYATMFVVDFGLDSLADTFVESFRAELERAVTRSLAARQEDMA